MDRKQLAMIAMGCFVLMFVGTLLDWPSFEGSDKVKDNLNGFGENVNGVAPFILGLLAAAGAALVVFGMTGLVPLDGRQLLFVSCALYALAALLAFFSPWDLPDYVQERLKDSLSRGIGVWLTTLGAIGGAAACYLATTKKKGSSASKPAAPKPDAEEKATTDDKPADDA